MASLLAASHQSFPLAILLPAFLSFLLLSSALATAQQHSVDFQALLCLRAHLSTKYVSSWKNDSSHFCQWPGVVCTKKPQTSRVIALELESFGLDGRIPPCISNFTFLTRMHFPGNQLSGTIPVELGQLSGLTYVNLSSNSFSGAMPNSLSSCSRLEIIDLSHNMLRGSIPEGLGRLANLSLLHLADNALTGNIPHSLGVSSALTSVVLMNNSLTGGIPLVLASSSSLQELDLTNNNLSGEIPPALFNSSSLRIMALGVNNFVGPISIPPFSHPNSALQYLILSQNNLTGSIPSSLGNFPSLRWLLLARNSLHGSIPVSISAIPHLKILDLTYNNLSGIVPPSLYNMSALEYLGIGINNLVGEIPDNIGHTLPSIQVLIMEGNRFKGQIPASLANATNLTIINFRNNEFHGIVPSFGSLLNLVQLDLGMNQFEAGDWSFFSSLASCTQLVSLFLDKNNLQGGIPHSIAHLPQSLEVLFLSKNKISGDIPPEIERLIGLTYLDLAQNFFTGIIPQTLGNLENLFALKLSKNKLSGQIPPLIGNLSQLSELHLQENRLSGSIPPALGQCKNLVFLNLSNNNFGGNIPKELFTISSLSEGLDLSNNQLSGHIPPEVGGLVNLSPLHISNNKLSGEIPSTIGQCVHLEYLHMDGNILGGTIPESFANLRGIVEIDLSQNNLSGKIPEFFESFSSLELLNLSFNKFEGSVPTHGVFRNATEVFIQGNEELCSSSLLFHLPLCKKPPSRQKHTSYTVKIIAPIISLVLVLLASLGFIITKRTKVKQPTYPSYEELKRVTYADIVRATNSFSSTSLIGSGKYGLVYRGIFDQEAHAVAIKVFKLDQLGTEKSFFAECEALRNTRHRNLVKVISACAAFDPTGHDFKALILEYMENGSLESWIHPNLHKYGLRRPLSLGLRIIIAVDMASALDYLHNHCMPPMIHCDLKPGNVLLDDVMCAHIGDFGLAKFVLTDTSTSINSSTSLVGPRGSIGYIPPEYGFGNKISREGDVYSYGVTILELVTGKCPTDKMFNNGLNLHKYVENAFPQKIVDILDPNLMPDADSNFENNNHAKEGILGCIMQLVKLGLSCSLEAPKDRPRMQDVYAEVTAIKEAFPGIGD